MRALPLLFCVVCAAPAIASPASVGPVSASPVSVGLDPDRVDRVQFNGDLGLTASGLPTARAEMIMAISGVQAKLAPLRWSSLGRLADNGAAAQGWHSATRSDEWLRLPIQPPHLRVAFLQFRQPERWFVDQLAPDAFRRAPLILELNHFQLGPTGREPR